MDRPTLTSGTVVVTVTLPDNLIVAQAQLGNEWHKTYSYRIERVDNPDGTFVLFLKTLTKNPRKSDDESRYVYTGIVHPYKGSVRLTAKSAFPATATRFKVADRVFQALFAGRADAIAAAGWTVTAEVLTENVDRF